MASPLVHFKSSMTVPSARSAQTPSVQLLRTWHAASWDSSAELLSRMRFLACCKVQSLTNSERYLRNMLQSLNCHMYDALLTAVLCGFGGPRSGL